MLNFLLDSLAVTLVSLLFQISYFLLTLAFVLLFVAFPPLGYSDVVVSASIDFSSKSKEDAPFHYTAYGYSSADWDDLHDHLRNDPWQDNFKLRPSAAAIEFFELFFPGWN